MTARTATRACASRTRTGGGRQGRPDLAQFAAAAQPGWYGHLPLNPCAVTGCNYGSAGRGLCNRHAKQWRRAGRPDRAAWMSSSAAAPPARPPAACRVGYCGLWAQGTSVFCHTHHDRWTKSGRPDPGEFAASRENPGPGQEHIDLRRLPAGLRLEIQYVLQCRGDEQDTRLPPADIRPFAAVLAAAGVSSLLDQPEAWWTALPSGESRHGWPAFILDARRRVEALASGAGWETEYQRDTWRLRVVGIARGDNAAIRFTGIPQPWLKDLAKRYARWQLFTGLTAATARAGVLGVTRFAAWLGSLPEPPAGLDGIDRPLLERYLAVLHSEMGGRHRHQHYVSALSSFLREIRRHGWDDDAMPATAAIYPEDFPPRGAAASPRPCRPRHGPGRAARQPRQAAQPCLPAHHADPHPLRAADLLSGRAALRLHRYRRRRRSLPALLQHQDETRGPCPR